MKSFETPYVEVKKFDINDILTTSGNTCPEFVDCPDETPEF